MAGQGRPLLADRRVPELDLARGPARGQDPAVGRERHGDRPARVGRQEEFLGPGRQVPELDQAVEAGRGQSLAVPGEGDPPDGPLMADEAGDRLARRGLPEPDRVVGPAGRERLAVGAEGHGEGQGRGLQLELEGAGRGVPGLDLAELAVGRPGPAGRGEGPAVGTEGQRPGPMFEPGQGRQDPAARAVADPDRPVAAGDGQPHPVGRDGHGLRPSRPPGQGLEVRPARVPVAEGLVGRGRDDRRAVEGDPEDRLGVPFQGRPLLARGPFPGGDRAVGVADREGRAVDRDGA